jgi:hypothetical protein
MKEVYNCICDIVLLCTIFREVICRGRKPSTCIPFIIKNTKIIKKVSFADIKRYFFYIIFIIFLLKRAGWGTVFRPPTINSPIFMSSSKSIFLQKRKRKDTSNGAKRLKPNPRSLDPNKNRETKSLTESMYRRDERSRRQRHLSTVALVATKSTS